MSAEFDDGNGAQKAIERCKKIFVSWSDYWKSALAGVLVLLGFAAGVIGWAMHIESQAAEVNVKIEQLEVQTNAISAMSSDLNLVVENQREILKLLGRKVK